MTSKIRSIGNLNFPEVYERQEETLFIAHWYWWPPSVCCGNLHFIFFSGQIDRFYCTEDSSHSIHVCSNWKIYHTVNLKCTFKDVLQHINSMNYTITNSNYLYKCYINRISFNFLAKNLYVYFLIWIYPVDVKHLLDIFNSGRWKLYEKIINAMIYSVI